MGQVADELQAPRPVLGPEAFEAAAIGFAIVDLDGRFRAANRSLCDLLGYRETELRGLNFRDLTHPDDVASDLALADRLLAGKIASYRLEKRLLHRQGHPVWVVMAISLIGDARGIPQYFLSQYTDITGQKAAENALAQRTRELERSNAELEEFAYVASHDLRQPLRTVSSYAELLAERYAGLLDAQADRWIEYMLDGVGRMQRLIDDLLELARVHTHGGAFVEVNAAAVLALAWEQVRDQYPVVSHLRYQRLPTVIADVRQLEQLFQNLFDNALKYRRPDVAPEIEVTAEPEGTEPVVWKFRVRDNGIGLDMAYADRIFEIFRRLHRDDGYEGTGIGLSICKRIVERHGGRITVESTPGRGTVFQFTLFGKPA